MRGARRILPWLALGLLTAWTGPPAAAEPSEAQVSAKVTYLAGSTIYVDAGRDDGLQLEDTLQVVRDGETVAVLQVIYLSASRASCKLVSGDIAIQVGDQVAFAPAAAAPETEGGTIPAPEGAILPVTEAAGTPAPAPARRPGVGIHGRIGVRYLALADRLRPDQDYSVPSVDLRLDGNRIGGSGWNMAVDVRARRINRTLTDGAELQEDRSRVYRAAVGWQGPNSPWRFAAGRQFVPNAAVVSIFDGLSGDYTGRRWAAGLFSGSQPDLLDYSYSSAIKEHGAWIQARGKPGGRHRWSVTTGLVGSYDQSEINREFIYLQEYYNGPRFSAYGLQEIDYNRDWKQEMGESTLALTSLFATLRYQAGANVWLRAGYDNRRNVRLYRDRITPATDFDDRFRRGAWVGTTLRFKQRYRVGLDLRTSGGQEDIEDTNTYSLFLSGGPFTGAGLTFNGRSSHYAGPTAEGWLYSLGLGLVPQRRIHLELAGGIRDDTLLRDLPVATTLTWYGLDLEFLLGRHWFLFLSLERDTGDAEEFDQSYAGVSYRF